MTPSAHDIAAELRRRMPGIGKKKLHKLLYYCQGHHLAVFNRPLFAEDLCAWDMGPVVAQVWRDERYDRPRPAPTTLGEAELNTIGYVLSRFGHLTGDQLEEASHREAPWLMGEARRKSGGDDLIEPSWVRDYFAEHDPAVVQDLAPHVREWLAGAEERLRLPAKPDDMEEIQARLSARA